MSFLARNRAFIAESIGTGAGERRTDSLSSLVGMLDGKFKYTHESLFYEEDEGDAIRLLAKLQRRLKQPRESRVVKAVQELAAATKSSTDYLADPNIVQNSQLREREASQEL
jgi:hypothetical protein